MRFTHARKHLFYTEIAKRVDAGFGIRDAARAMLDTRLPPLQAGLLRAMDRDLEAGRSIAEAFGAGNPEIGELERRIIGAGERAGRLAPTFQQLADYFGMLAAARRDALQGMAYPLLLLHLGLFAGVLVPGLMAQSDFAAILGSFGLALLALYAAVFVAGLGLRALQAAAAGNAALDRALNALPLLGRARRALAMARFTKVYHGALLAGLPMAETVETAARASSSAALGEAGRQLVAVLAQGGALGPTFISCGAFPPAFARSYATAEEAGGLDKDLARWSALYQDDAARGVKNAAGLLSKLLYFAVLLFVAWTVIRAYSGYLGEMEKILGD
jgi:type II secretory pathway component PulF